MKVVKRIFIFALILIPVIFFGINKTYAREEIKLKTYFDRTDGYIKLISSNTFINDEEIGSFITNVREDPGYYDFTEEDTIRISFSYNFSYFLSINSQNIPLELENIKGDVLTLYLNRDYYDFGFIKTEYYTVNMKHEVAIGATYYVSWVGSDFDLGYNSGYDKGYEAGFWEARGNMDQYSYDLGFDFGYQEGLAVDQAQAYLKGYQDGSNDSFTGNIHKWIVPAIIIVIILGGITYFKSRGRWEE